MKIARVEVATFRLPLSRRYKVGTVDTEQREGRFVRLVDESGYHGYGEIAPLPGLHRESLADVDAALAEMGSGLAGREFVSFDAFAENTANRVAATAAGAAKGCPSVIFGLQMAGMSLFAGAADTTPAGILSRSPRDRVAVNALFVGSPAAAAEAVASGELDAYGCVKVKFGAQSVAQDRDVFRILLSGLAENVELRLDANRSLQLDDAVARLKGLPPERIEFVEEPLADPSQLAALHGATGLAMGLDETLHEPALRNIGRANYVAAWCLKPSLIGHWGRMQFLAKDAERSGSTLVVSSALETGLALWTQAQIAAALPGEATAAGLGTESWLRLDTVTPPYDSSQGIVRTCDWQGAISERVLQVLRFKRAA